jgi:hypothetical protein
MSLKIRYIAKQIYCGRIVGFGDLAVFVGCGVFYTVAGKAVGFAPE